MAARTVSRGAWVAVAAVAAVATYAIGAIIAYGDSARDPNVASFASVAMALLVIVSIIVSLVRRDSGLPVSLARLALLLGIVGIAVTLLVG